MILLNVYSGEFALLADSAERSWTNSIVKYYSGNMVLRFNSVNVATYSRQYIQLMARSCSVCGNVGENISVCNTKQLLLMMHVIILCPICGNQENV